MFLKLLGKAMRIIPFKSSDLLPLLCLPFCQAYRSNLTSRCVVLFAAPQEESYCYGGSGDNECTVGPLSCCITRSVLQLYVGASRLAGGVKSLLRVET